MTLIDKIEKQMRTDDAPRARQSEYLKEEYARADKTTKKAIDMCFIALCGWSLETMINGGVK